MCVEDAPAAERLLADFGLRFDLHATHAGQGTANACAFFDNAYLELLWRHDGGGLQSEAVRPVALWERVRWRQTGASPFGIALRPADGESAAPTWPYHAAFLPAGSYIPIVTPSHTPHEPLVFLIPGSLPIRVRTPAEHRGRRRTLTGVTVAGPYAASPSAALAASAGVRVVRADDHHLAMEWDGGVAGESRDFRPHLPLVLCW